MFQSTLMRGEKVVFSFRLLSLTRRRVRQRDKGLSHMAQARLVRSVRMCERVSVFSVCVEGKKEGSTEMRHNCKDSQRN